MLNALHVLAHLFKPPNHVYEVGTILIFNILETRKLRGGEVKVLAQVYTNKATGRLIPEFLYLIPCYVATPEKVSPTELISESAVS